MKTRDQVLAQLRAVEEQLKGTHLMERRQDADRLEGARAALAWALGEAGAYAPAAVARLAPKKLLSADGRPLPMPKPWCPACDGNRVIRGLPCRRCSPSVGR